MKCPITGQVVEDDCHIKIEYGYGSPKDMMTYKFGPVSHDAGEMVLALLKGYVDVEKFCTHDADNDVLQDKLRDIFEAVESMSCGDIVDSEDHARWYDKKFTALAELQLSEDEIEDLFEDKPCPIMYARHVDAWYADLYDSLHPDEE